ncbi:MAG: cytochrome c1 [Gammaproteobacteria bacterium]|nr:cytochrome c1 [Gammaproteobacteria bacterium]
MYKWLGLSLGFIVALGGGSAAIAAGGAAMPLEHADNDVSNTASLQRGARNFMNYCSGCHSAKYVRFNTIAADLGLSEDQLIDNLMFNAERPHDTIERTMRDEDAIRWFGTSPPDLSLIPRSRGIDYVYNFLQAFYVDPDSPTGVDNVLLAGTSMPHVLWELQGYQRAIFTPKESASGTEYEFDSFEPVTAGTMSAVEFDGFVRDTVNFLDYISEPVQLKRRVLGVWVLMFLTVFLIIAMMLKKQIWKDVPS